MCRSPLRVNTLNHQGFTLVEMAVVLLIFGMLMSAGISVYHQYLRQERQKTTELALAQGRDALENYVSLYGRYPCPAPANAVLGDMDYGRESRDPATGDCVDVLNGVWRTESENTALSNRDVFIGSLPFRGMNLAEDWVQDGYHSRITYAVTGLLTDSATFSNADGGITIVDEDDNPVNTLNPDGAHYALIVHNERNEGAISHGGVMIGDCSTLALEQENCDYDTDTIFRVAQKQNDFDDLVYYTVSDTFEPWQLQEGNVQNIHLRRADNVALGVDAADSTAGLATLEVQDTGGSAGVVFAQQDPDPAVTGTGVFITDQLCSEAGNNCFDPLLIHGNDEADADGGGLFCDPGEFLVQLANGDSRCESEIWFNCPGSAFFLGFNPDGSVRCGNAAPPSCPTQTMPATCGGTRSVSSIFHGGEWYGYAYSGQCHRVGAISTATLASAASVADVQAYIDSLNAAPRTSVDCGPTSSLAQVRDTFSCEGGVWNTTPIRTIERTSAGTVLSSQAPTGGNLAELTGPSYIPASPMASDPSNNNNYHDCWCREDYRVVTQGCSGPFVGTEFRVDVHRCPQTSHNWSRVYPSSGFDQSGCSCVSSTAPASMACSVAFGLGTSHIGVSGTVNYQEEVTCPSGATVPVGGSYDYSNCRCPARSPSYPTTACPVGTSNSFIYDGVTYTNVSQLRKRDWVCPTGPAPQQPITSATQAGYYTAPVLVHTEPCNCDATLTQDETQACPAGYSGSGRLYRKPWNCATSSFDPAGPDNLISDDCHLCRWQAGSPRSGLDTIPAPRQLNAPCPSCSGTSSCFTALGPDQYKIYDGCYCAGQP